MRVLNYAPGPMDTAMNVEICNTCEADSVRQAFLDMRAKVTTCCCSWSLLSACCRCCYCCGAVVGVASISVTCSQGQLVRPDDSAEKLVSLLATRSFETGKHIDYYDIK